MLMHSCVAYFSQRAHDQSFHKAHQHHRTHCSNCGTSSDLRKSKYKKCHKSAPEPSSGTCSGTSSGTCSGTCPGTCSCSRTSSRTCYGTCPQTPEPASEPDPKSMLWLKTRKASLLGRNSTGASLSMNSHIQQVFTKVINALESESTGYLRPQACATELVQQ